MRHQRFSKRPSARRPKKICSARLGGLFRSTCVAYAPFWRLVVAFVVRKGTQASTNLLLERVAQVTDEHIPSFSTDQLAEYRIALLFVYEK